MKVVVIGLGSMGKRRIRLLNQYIVEEKVDKEEWEIIGVDSKNERRAECEESFRIKTFSSVEEAIENSQLDSAIVSTSPISHADIIQFCLENGLHVFTELNLIDKGYTENLALAKERGKVLFLSATFIYRKEIEYMKKRTREVSFRGMYQYHIGQYLPDWHPWESYKDFFIGKKETNGCREIFAVELPWLIDTFGEIKSYQSIHKKMTSLDIDYDDCYQLILEHESGTTGCLIVDLVIPEMSRKFKMWQENFCISWDGAPDTLREYDRDRKVMVPITVYEDFNHKQGYNYSIVEDAYYDELVNFIQVIKGENKARYSFEKDKKILSLIDLIEK